MNETKKYGLLFFGSYGMNKAFVTWRMQTKEEKETLKKRGYADWVLECALTERVREIDNDNSIECSLAREIFDFTKYPNVKSISTRDYEGSLIPISEKEFQKLLNKFEADLKRKTEEKRKQREQKEKDKLQKLQKLRRDKLEEAKIKGKNVIIRCIGGYDGDEAHPGQELGWVNIYEIATPEGKIIEEESPTY